VDFMMGKEIGLPLKTILNNSLNMLRWSKCSAFIGG